MSSSSSSSGAITFSATTRSSPSWTRPVDDAHPAAPDQRLDPVAGDDRAGLERPHRTCIAESGSWATRLNRAARACVWTARGPEQTPSQDPPPDGRHLLPRPGHGGPGRSEGNTFPGIAALPRHLRHGSPQPGHGLDRLRRRLRRADGPRRSAQRATSRCASARSTRRRAGCSSARARASREFLPHVMLRVQDVMREDFPQARRVRAGARGRPADGAPGPRPRADRRRRRRARGRDDRARAGPALHPRVARAVRAGRADDASARSSACSRASCVTGSEDAEVSGQIWCMAMDIGSLPSEIGPGRRGRGRQPRRRAARGDRARRRPAGHQQRHAAERRRRWRSRPSAACRSSARRWTAT